MITANQKSRYGAVILCGGESSRMGRDKASLPFGPNETMLQRIIRIVGEVVAAENTVIAAGLGQAMPQLPSGVRVLYDELEGAGPLPALAAGLRSLGVSVEAAFVTGCDAPLLQPDVICFLLAKFSLANKAGVVDAVVPSVGDFLHPLAAVYAPHAAQALQSAYESGRRSLHGALSSEGLSVLHVPAGDLSAAGPMAELSLANCNTDADYRAALSRANLNLPSD